MIKALFIILISFIALSGCSTSAAHDGASGSASVIVSAVDSRPPGAIDDMIAIPSGYYPWDTRTCNKAADYERTAHAYQIDRNLVTCDAYRACVTAKHCPSFGRNTCPYTHTAKVSRNAAAKYCGWRGAELPSTGQWQKAARKDDRFFPNGYVFDLLHTCKVPDTHDPIEFTRCYYTSPYGMIVNMIQSSYDGEWTREDSCPADADETPKPLAIALEYRLDALVVPLDPRQEFRCVRTD